MLWKRLFQKKEGYLAPLGADERGYCAEHVLAVAALCDAPAFPERLPDRNKSGYDAILHKRRKPPSANICHLVPSGALYNVTPVDWS